VFVEELQGLLQIVSKSSRSYDRSLEVVRSYKEIQGVARRSKKDLL
jgi:hypothetical protein